MTDDCLFVCRRPLKQKKKIVQSSIFSLLFAKHLNRRGGEGLKEDISTK